MLKAGLRSWGSAGFSDSKLRVMGRRLGREERVEEEEFVRVCPCPGTRVLERVLEVETFRKCRDCVTGGLDLSFFTGSASTCD